MFTSALSGDEYYQLIFYFDISLRKVIEDNIEEQQKENKRNSEIYEEYFKALEEKVSPRGILGPNQTSMKQIFCKDS